MACFTHATEPNEKASFNRSSYDTTAKPQGEFHDDRFSLNTIRRLTMAAALAIPMAALPVAHAQIGIGIGISVHIAPPPLPVYVQPPLPAAGYIWTPGYWAYGDAGYYWVPGTWVLPPQPGYLWTPGYWGYAGGTYGWHAGYWGPTSASMAA